MIEVKSYLNWRFFNDADDIEINMRYKIYRLKKIRIIKIRICLVFINNKGSEWRIYVNN